jgi:hypothetical protein
MDASVLRSFRSLLAAMALWMTACAIAGSADSVATAKASPGSAAYAPVTWLRSATDDLDVHLHAARQIPEDAASPNLRTAAASSWSLGMKDASADKAPVRSVATANTGAQQPDLWTFLGSAQMPIGWAFVLASIGLMTAIARRRQFD